VASGIGCLPINNLLKSTTVRVAVLFVALFIGLTGLLMLVVLLIVQDTQTATLDRGNAADIEMVINAFNEEGLEEAVEVIRQRQGPVRHGRSMRPESYILLQDAHGAVLGGNLLAWPARDGNDYRAPLPDGAPGEESSAMLRGATAEIADAKLFVGRDIEPLAAIRMRIVNAFLWVTVGALITAMSVGLFLGRRFSERVEAVALACRSIVAGRMHERIGLRGRDDEWDRLGRAINDMLNRIAELLENLRQVSSDVAHDMRTPLARLRNRLETAKASATNVDDYAVAVGAAIEDTDQLLSMFEAVLRISQVEAGSGVRRLSSVDLSALCERIYRMYLPVAEDYAHHITAQLDGEIHIDGDAELLTQMFVNLIENAISHTPPGTEIRLLLKRHKGRIVATLSDAGPGIPAEQTQKVLRRFYRLESSRSAPGHGLGLALVAAIAQLHGAKLALEDAKPGLSVSIEFPQPAK
jgi:signal transduction histidine kinase